ncbi:serine hydrolase, partial [Oxalobacter sp. OttesenSCG-928-P03]|nr:serine hydrolase [Oxalobacter sp. OttesenSCG-928-P03]
CPDEHPSGGSSMIGTAHDVMRLVEAIRTNRVPTIGENIMRQMSVNQLPEGIVTDPGTGFGLGWAVTLNPAEANVPYSAGALSWGGVYGHKWFADPQKRLSVVILTTTAMEEALTTGVTQALYANLPG